MARGLAHSRWFGLRALALLLLGAPLLVPTEHAAPPAVTALLDLNEATAAYLLNFVRFTEWPAAARPASPAAPYVIGVSCSGAQLNALLDLLEGQTVHGHPVRAIRIKNVADFASCHLVYLECSDPCGAQAIPIHIAINTLRGSPVLTVSAAPDFLAQGGHIQLFHSDARLRFAIADEIAHKTGLALNSRLLALARPVPPQP